MFKKTAGHDVVSMERSIRVGVNNERTRSFHRDSRYSPGGIFNPAESPGIN